MSPWAGVIRSLSPGARVFVAGCAGEPSGLAAALRSEPERAPDLVFTSVPIPGVNRIDWSVLSAGGRYETIFVTPELRDGIAAGRVRFRPLHYTETARLLGTPGHVDVAVVRVAPAPGGYSLGLAADFAPAPIAAGARLVGEVDASMPVPRSAPVIPQGRFDALVESPGPRPAYDPGPVPPAVAAVGRHVAALVPDGATLQLGLGKVQGAVLAALAGRTGLRYHAGMIADALRPVADAFSRGITTGVAVGSEAFGAWAAAADIRFAPVSETHAPATLAALPAFTAVNSVLAVDLFGQAVADVLDGRQVSGHGGLLDFVRGARLSPGGRSVLALAATAGGRSRIVPVLAGPVTVPRGDADLVVTEHGVADLRHKDLDERAAALIAIAAEDHREPLAAAWHDMRRRM